MGKHVQLVVGPAGAGKSTFCNTMYTHLQTIRRSVNVVNMDPAAEHFEYPVSIDIRELVNLDDVMEELSLGPNGGLIYCLEFLIDNVDWFEEKINDYQDDYLIIDCPGQVELYTHLPVMKRIVSVLQRLGYQICVVYMMDAMLISDPSRFIAGSMMCMSVMAQLELPHISVLSKCDLIQDKGKIEGFLTPDTHSLLQNLNANSHDNMAQLNAAIAELVEEYSMVAFVALDNTDEESVETVLGLIDTAMQYGEDLEPKDLPNEGADAE